MGTAGAAVRRIAAGVVGGCQLLNCSRWPEMPLQLRGGWQLVPVLLGITSQKAHEMIVLRGC